MRLSWVCRHTHKDIDEVCEFYFLLSGITIMHENVALFMLAEDRCPGLPPLEPHAGA